MDLRGSSLSMEPTTATSTAKMSKRRHPLHTCGVSISAIACQAYTRAQDLRGPIGFISKSITKLATPKLPFIHVMRYQWLAVLSFLSYADNQILAAENVIEALFPPSTRLFDKIDELVHTTETLPEKFDDVLNKFPKTMHKFWFLDWALICVLSWLKFWVAVLTQWGSKSSNEKDIMVDSDCKNLMKEPKSAEGAYFNPEKPSDSSEDETKTSHKNVVKCSYKEMLEKGKDENEEDSPKAMSRTEREEEE